MNSFRSPSSNQAFSKKISLVLMIFFIQSRKCHRDELKIIFWGKAFTSGFFQGSPRNDEIQQQFSLPPHTTVYSTELVAIYLALRQLNKFKPTPPLSVVIISDSKAPIKHITKPFTHHPLYTKHFTIFPISQLQVQLYLGTRTCLLYTSPSPRDRTRSRMPSSA